MKYRALIVSMFIAVAMVVYLAVEVEGAFAAARTPHTCTVRGPVPVKALVSGINCTVAQLVWDHFVIVVGYPVRPLPPGWRCLHFSFSEYHNETDCAFVDQHWVTWARFQG